jgi:multidrug efflux pump
LFIVWGLTAYITIPKESTPDVKIPTIYVSVFYEGISPQDSARLLLKPLEQQLRSLEGVKRMQSTAYEGGASIVLEFHAGFDSNKALNDVRDKIDFAKPSLPKDAREPQIQEINSSLFPILVVKLSGDVPLRALYHLVRDLKDEIESNVSSVLKAEIVGDREDVIEILIDPVAQEKYNLILERIMQRFSQNNQVVPAGNLEKGQGKFSIKVPGLLESIRDIQNFPLLSNERAIIRLKDIADIRRSFKDPTSIAHDRIALGHSTSTVALEISKRAGENLIETVEKVKKVISNLSKNWPQHIQVSYAQDESDHIRDMLNDLQNSIILAILLVMAVIIFSLGWRSALLVSLAIPGSFLMGIMVISLLGYTMNIVVLFSLIFSVGMLVDGAIIVVEYADRCISSGVLTKEAYRKATIRMVWPVITSITTILVIFLPLLFWPGVVGQFMKFMPITLIAVLVASLLMALIFIPAIASLMTIPPHKPDAASLEDCLVEWYVKILKKGLNQPKRVLQGAVVILIVVKLLHSFIGKGVEFFPDVEPDMVAVYVHARGNLSIHEMERLVSQVEKVMLDMPELKSVYTRIGAQSLSGQDVIGTIAIEFIDWQKRRKVRAILDEIEQKTAHIPGVVVEVQGQNGGPSAGKPIQIQLTSMNPQLLKPSLIKLRTFMKTVPELVGIEDNFPLPGIEWQLRIDRDEALKVGCDITSIGNTIKLITNGAIVGSYRPDDVKDEVDIMVRFLPQYRSLDQLDQLRVQTDQGSMPLSRFVKRIAQDQVGQVYHLNGEETLSLKADVAPTVLVSDKLNEIQKWLKANPLNSKVRVIFQGEDEDQKEAGSFLIKAFGIAIFLVAAILVTQFNSFFSMGLVLSAVVMSTVGVFIGLMLHNLAFSIVMGGIGIIASGGIIVSNNIILIDTYDKLLDEMKQCVKKPTLSDVRHVVIETCRQRFRPVILTKLTVILGLLPIMFGVNIDFINLEVIYGAPSAQWWGLLSTCIVYGILFASSLTLFVTPCVLLLRTRKAFHLRTIEKLGK